MLFLSDLCRESLALLDRFPRIDIRINDFFQCPLRFQDVFDCVAGSAGSSGRGRVVVCHLGYLWSGVSHSDGQPAALHDRQINDVVADVGNLVFEKIVLPQDLVQHVGFVVCTLK